MIVESDIDWEEEGAQTDASTSAVTKPVEAPVQVDNNDNDTDEHHSCVTAAITKVEQVFSVVEVPRKRCHCKLAWGSGRGNLGRLH